MKQEEKQLLIKDLCARLPYSIWGLHRGEDLPLYVIDDSGAYMVLGYNAWFNLDTVPFKPYLRPMSSMTEEEYKEYDRAADLDVADSSETLRENLKAKSRVRISKWYHGTDWLNAHQFDYRGLIPMGLALEAPEGMYNKEESEKGSEIPIPKTVDEAISTLEKILSDDDREYLLKNGAISMHDSLGRWIRNEWGLWTNSELKNELKKKGFEHPDDMSNYVIEEFIKYWNNKL